MYQLLLHHFYLYATQNTGSLEDMSELRDSYINHNTTRPVIARIPDNDELMKV